MSKYRRIVIYLYYCQDNMAHNAGFAKMELQNGRCRLEVHVKTPQLEAAPVYLFSRKEELLYGVDMGTLKLENGRGSFVCVFDMAQIGESPFSYDDMKGILIPQGRENMIAGQWDKKDVIRQQFRVWERQEEDNKTEPDEKNETIQKEAGAKTSEIAEIGKAVVAAEATTEKKQNLQRKDDEEAGENKIVERDAEAKKEEREEAGENKIVERDTEAKKEEREEAGENKIVERDAAARKEEREEAGENKIVKRDAAAREKADENSAEIQTEEIQMEEIQTEEIQTERNERNVTEERAGEYQKNQEEKNQGITGGQLVECGLGESNLAEKLVEYSNLKGGQEAGKEITAHFSWSQLWNKLIAKREIFIPGEGTPVEAVKMDLKDLHQLPKELWPLGNNSFLLHGFFNYRFLIYGKEQGESEVRFLLGVPGVFSNQERVLANIFGFPGFFTEKKEKFQTGNAGYWYRYFQ